MEVVGVGEGAGAVGREARKRARRGEASIFGGEGDSFFRVEDCVDERFRLIVGLESFSPRNLVSLSS